MNRLGPIVPDGAFIAKPQAVNDPNQSCGLLPAEDLVQYSNGEKK